MQKSIYRIVSSFLIFILVFTNNLAFTVSTAQESRAERTQKLQQIKAATTYVDMKAGIHEKDHAKLAKKLSAVR